MKASREVAKRHVPPSAVQLSPPPVVLSHPVVT